MDRIDRRGESGFPFGGGDIVEKRWRKSFFLNEFRDHDAGLLVGKARPVELPAGRECGEQEGPVVGRRLGEGEADAAAGLGGILPEAVRHREDGDFLREGMLPPELADGRFGEVRDLLRELGERADFVGERAGDADALLRLDQVLEFDAGLALQLFPGAKAGEGEQMADGGFAQARVVPGRPDPHRVEFSHRAAPDAPDVGDGEAAEHLLDVFAPVQIAAAFEPGVLLAELGGDLREGLGRGDADGNRDGGQAPAFRGNAPGEGVEVRALHPAQVEEGFVDRVLLDRGREAAQNLLHAGGHIAIKGEIARKDADPVALDDVADLEKRVAHLDPERLGLVRSRHRAAVVVGEHDDGFPVEIGSEDPFAGNEKVVAVGQGVNRGAHIQDKCTFFSPINQLGKGAV